MAASEVGHAGTSASGSPSRETWSEELINVIRALSGGLLFGVPLLYTMEVWWTGSRTTPIQMAIVLALLFVPVFVLNKTAGFRATRDVRIVDAAADTIEAVAIGIVSTGAVLVLVRQITSDTPIGMALGMILYEAIPFCLGVGVARHFLRGSRDERGDDPSGGRRPSRRDDLDGTLADLGATAIGAVFISLSIAPTDEVPMIASSMGPGWLLVLVAASLVISYAVVFIAGFRGQEQRHAQEGIFQRPITETLACYLLALVTALVLLAVFQRGAEHWPDLLARVIVLGLPAAIGGAAGRLAV